MNTTKQIVGFFIKHEIWYNIRPWPKQHFSYGGIARNVSISFESILKFSF